ncbi:Mur ligase family protein [Alicyclobacillus vulcanalis]|uniref:Lipid II isoglutaminyl synthase (glutamine-hydrolyzing) subunit MurT n=1 Tax=Alicyclobacillus vulcanalis TaxID=252246 RepID=A0A1N7LXA4_9BACL|nr:Mur ligase family protein [Alicyclobacillus vulcanalis]SIS78447.1 UDP-N-acetylmuramyl tripeptide synthase [Alicyclobacillus vulcanalis]
MLGILVGKLILWLLTLRGRDATSLPGKVALAISPGLIRRFGRRVKRVIAVTGTNGKTTTTSMLASMIAANEAVITNHKGANLPQGIATAFLKSCSWTGRLKANLAVLEIDEATLPKIAADLPIGVIVVTNVFRDQLDRYGELDGTLAKLLEGIRKTQATIVLNADDPLCRYLGLRSSRQDIYFGMARDTARSPRREQMRDGQFCLMCGHPLKYDAFWYGQLGLYRCEHCDFVRPHPAFQGRLEGGFLRFSEAGLPDLLLDLPVSGLYNAYNVLAATAAARTLGLSSAAIHAGLRMYRPPEGRMQRFDLEAPVTLHLIKNPTGCDSVLDTVVSDPRDKVMVIGINDLAADGRDVSWLWDADFELVAEDARIQTIVATGYRAHDMALRLKYAGVPEAKLRIEPDLAAALQEGVRAGASTGAVVHTLVTYTLLSPAARLLAERRDRLEPQGALYRPSVS